MSTVKMGKGYSLSKELFDSEFGPMTQEEESTYQKEEFEQGISETLFDMRIARNISREDLAKKTGMAVDDIIRLESDGSTVKWNEALLYATALGFKPKVRFEYQEPVPVAEISVTLNRGQFAKEPVI